MTCFIPCTKCADERFGSICGAYGGLRGTGPEPADLMIIGDFPHDTDYQFGQHLSGGLGNELLGVLNESNIDSANVYKTSVVKCRIVAQNGKEGTILKAQSDNCALYLEEEIAAVEPKVIVLMGAHAFRRFFPRDNFTGKRGTFMWSEKYNCYFVATYHFQAMLGSAKFDPIIKKDYKNIGNYLNTGVVSAGSPTDYRYMLSEADLAMLEKFVQRMAFLDEFSFDIETSSKDYRTAKMLSIGFSWKKDTGWSIPIWVKDEETISAKYAELTQEISALETQKWVLGAGYDKATIAQLLTLPENAGKKGADIKKETTKAINAAFKVKLSEAKQKVRDYDVIVDKHTPLKKYWGDKHDDVMHALRRILTNTAKKGGHNSWFDMQMLAFMGIDVQNYDFDTIVEHQLLDEERQHGLDPLSWLYTERGGYKASIDDYLPNSDTCWANIPLDVLLPYNTMDADITYQLHQLFTPKLKQDGLYDLYRTVIIPAQKTLLKMAFYGVMVDEEFIKRQQKNYLNKMNDCIVAIQAEVDKKVSGYKIVGSGEEAAKVLSDHKNGPHAAFEPPKVYNLAASQQMAELLINVFNITLTEQTKTGWCLDEKVLSGLKRKCKVAEHLLKHREYAKAKSTYLDSALENMDDAHRLHTTYKLAHTVTGRTASENPNLQNQPRDGSIKGMFIPTPGKVLVNVDMSQHELRVLSGLANDPVMKQVYAEGRDLHYETASGIFGVPVSQVTKDQRTAAKRVNFGIPYGVSGVGLIDILEADGIHITKTQGNEYIKGWKAKFPHAAAYLERCKRDFMQGHLLITPWGRRRRKYKTYANQGKESGSERQAMNYPIQSFASDIVLSLIVKLYPILEPMGIKMMLTVHDSIVMECDESQIQDLARIVKEHTFVYLPELNGALVCTEMEAGYRWSEMSPVNFDEPEYSKWTITSEKGTYYYWGGEQSAKKFGAEKNTGKDGVVLTHTVEKTC